MANYDVDSFKKDLVAEEERLKDALSGIRTGQAAPAALDGVKVEAYGAFMGLKEVASIFIESARFLRVVPWDRAQIREIEKAVTAADLGVSVASDAEGVRIGFPELTSDKRKDFARMAKDRLEDARKHIRVRRDRIVKDLQAREKTGGWGKDDVFRLKNEIQKLVDEANKKLDGLCARKELEIMG